MENLKIEKFKTELRIEKIETELKISDLKLSYLENNNLSTNELKIALNVFNKVEQIIKDSFKQIEE